MATIMTNLTSKDKRSRCLMTVFLFSVSMYIFFHFMCSERSISNSSNALTKRDANDKTSLKGNTTLTHYHGSYYRSDFVSIMNSKPTSTSLVTRNNLEERFYIWFTVKMIIDFGLSGYSLYATVRDCRDWSKGDSSGKKDCVMGAIATAVSFAGIGGQIYNNYDKLRAGLASLTSRVPSKRDGNFGTDYALEGAKILAGGSAFDVAALYRADGSWAQNDQTGWPIYLLRNEAGDIYHFSTMNVNETHHVYRIATSHSKIYNAKRDEQFNLENFSEGGIESGMEKKKSSSSAAINTSGDYGTLGHQVSCQVDMNAHAYQYILWDYNHNTDMGSGWFYAYQNDTYNDVHAQVIPYPGTSAPDMGNCYVS